MGATPAHPTLVNASLASWRVDESNNSCCLTDDDDDDDGLSLFDWLSCFGVASVADGSCLVSVGLLLSVGSSTTLAKNRVLPAELLLSLSSAVAKSGAILLLL